MQFLERMKSSISIINGLLILVIFLRIPLTRCWIRNIVSRTKKLHLNIGDEKKIFNCIQKELVSEVEFDCPPKTMDNGSRKVFLRGYRLKVNVLIWGSKFSELLANIGKSELKIKLGSKSIPLLPIFVSKEGKDTRALFESFKIIKEPPHGTSIKVNPPSSNFTKRFIASALLDLDDQDWYGIYQEKIRNAEDKYRRR